MSREPECSGAVEEISQLVSGGLATGGVAGPAAGGNPLLAVAGSVGVNGDQADISHFEVLATGVDSFGAGAEGDVVFFACKQLGIEAPVLEMLDYGGCDFTCVCVFPEYAGRATKFYLFFQIRVGILYRELSFRKLLLNGKDNWWNEKK